LEPAQIAGEAGVLASPVHAVLVRRRINRLTATAIAVSPTAL